MRNSTQIGERTIGPGHPCFLLAEAGVNHNGDPEMARRLVDAAADAGADAVKFQTFRADTLATPDAPKARYQTETTDAEESQLDMLRRLELSPESHRDLIAHCRKRSILFLSSPFDESCADFLEELDLPAFKIPSGELTNLPFLAHVARKGRPIILSTGMADLAEVETAVDTIRHESDPGLVLLQCVSNYPARPADVNLRAMATMASAFDTPVGYSDHIPGNEIAFAAVALGACLIEKHFTLDRSLPGPDHRASLDPEGLRALVQGVRAVEAALGSGEKRPAQSETDTARVARKSLVARRDIAAGTLLTADMIEAKRPGTGLSPAMLSTIIGRAARADIAQGALLRQEDLA